MAKWERDACKAKAFYGQFASHQEAPGCANR
eukprot:CAMPEP_0179157788 /NCGR_PEP_ID=MMETSP0796-20121207/76969_1 /TAXON_ID=73915 /ORGANISM="Pyrodinium bahamense, Strain pbaha01" /LENGTH=30 /DNA_ID= /DNA_START= /DNA_END= /DNA_ORIENTATION=